MTNSLTKYFAIGAVLAGLINGYHSERCGTYQAMGSVELISIVIGWPSGLGALFFDFEVPEIKCKGVGQ